jgi:hypothetical protein
MTAAKTPARKTAARKTTSSAAGPYAIRLLVDDHKQVHGLFQQYKKLVKAEAEADERRPLAEEICMLLTVHATIEEEIFYPAARAADVDSDLLDEAEVEHASAKALIAQIRDMSGDDDLYDAKVTVLGEYIDHHVEEEQDEMFPKCRKSSMDLKGLGAQLAERKAQLMSEMAEGMEVVG